MSVTATNTRKCRFCPIMIPYITRKSAGDGTVGGIDYLCAHHLRLFRQWRELSVRPPFPDFLAGQVSTIEQVSLTIVPKDTVFSSKISGGQLVINNIPEQSKWFELFESGRELELVIKYTGE